MAKATTTWTKAVAVLRAHALTYPETVEEHPWEHSAFKVKGKTFLFLYTEKNLLNLTVKLPVSHGEALQLPFASPTGYGLGKSGWVTAKFAGTDVIPVDMLLEWVDESFRAIAPKKVLAAWEARDLPDPKPQKRKPKRKRS